MAPRCDSPPPCLLRARLCTFLAQHLVISPAPEPSSYFHHLMSSNLLTFPFARSAQMCRPSHFGRRARLLDIDISAKSSPYPACDEPACACDRCARSVSGSRVRVMMRHVQTSDLGARHGSQYSCMLKRYANPKVDLESACETGP